MPFPPVGLPQTLSVDPSPQSGIAPIEYSATEMLHGFELPIFVFQKDNNQETEKNVSIVMESLITTKFSFE